MFRGLPLAAAIVLMCLAPSGAEGMEVSGRTEVLDGDTLVVGGTIIRLHGIDLAEAGQRCVGEGCKINRPGDRAKELLEQLAADCVSCAGSEHDDYGRLIVVCRTSDGRDIDRALVAAGWAWAFVRYSSDYVAEEREARNKSLGVWSMAYQPPW